MVGLIYRGDKDKVSGEIVNIQSLKPSSENSYATPKESDKKDPKEPKKKDKDKDQLDSKPNQ